MNGIGTVKAVLWAKDRQNENSFPVPLSVIIVNTLGTMLQAERSHVRFSMRLLNSFNFPNPSSGNMALGFTQPVT
jgi:hypothetical protein